MRSHAKAPSEGSIGIVAAAALAAALLILAFAAAPARASIESVVAEGASAERNSATLNGYYVSADGKEAHYYFEWGTTNTYGNVTQLPPGAVAGTEVGFQSVPPVQISGLTTSTTYHYRLVVSDADGIKKSEDATFTTPPAVANLTADPATSITGTSAELNASFDGDGTNETSYYFEWGPNSDYGNTAPVPPGNTLPAGTERIQVPAVAIGGLEPGTIYHYRVKATNSTGTTVSADASFKTAEAPLINSVRSANVTADSAELLGSVNPRWGQTSYHFEWGPTAAYGNSTPVEDAGAGNASVPITTQQISGLNPGVTYHFRLVATNQYGTTASPDQTFGFFPANCPNAQVRQETRSNALPDCRAYELVTPGDARGTTLIPVNAPIAPYATSPSKIAYSAKLGTFADEGQANGVSDMEVSTRTDSGWFQKYVGLSITESQVMGGPPQDWIDHWQIGFVLGTTELSFLGTQASPNLDRMILYALGWPTNFDLNPSTGGLVGHASNAPYLFDTSTGARLGRWPTNLDAIAGGDGFVGVPQASPDFSHFVFSSNVIFSDDGAGEASNKAIQCCSGGDNPNPPPKGPIYDNDVKTGTVRLASLKSDNVTQFQGYVYDISSDGSRILMGEGATEPKGLIARDRGDPIVLSGPFYLRVEGERTYEIAPGHPLRYVGSTDDGKTVYFTSPDQLTPDDQDASVDLFMWEESQPDQLTRISSGNSDSCGASWVANCDVEIINFYPYAAGSGGDGGHGAADTFIAGASGDVYFESPEQLIPNRGDRGQVNLYLYRRGSLRYVTTMSPDSSKCVRYGNESLCSTRPIARMQVTPDGNHMAFVTSSNVTSYDSQQFWEMYGFDPASGQIECVSCRPDGAAPTGDVLGSQNGRFITDDGRTFFSTVDPLVPRDTNKALDVYEYTEGRAQPISAGLGQEISTQTSAYVGHVTKPGLIGVSANGTDVYFQTIDTLVTQDHNGAQMKIYDARTGGGFPAEVTPPNCAAADECHGQSAAAPVMPPDRTSAKLATPKKTKAKKKAKKKHKARKHHKRGKKKPAKAAQGGSHRG